MQSVGRRQALVALPLAAVALVGAAVLLLLSAARLPSPDGEGRAGREVYVRDVVSAEAIEAEVVVLQTVNGAELVPIFVSPEDGEVIRRLETGEGASPATLLARTVDELGGSIDGAFVDLEGGSLVARVLVRRRGRATQVEARPAEAIAVAIAAGRPIWASREALEENGFTREDLARLAEVHEAREEVDERPAVSF